MTLSDAGDAPLAAPAVGETVSHVPPLLVFAATAKFADAPPAFLTTTLRPAAAAPRTKANDSTVGATESAAGKAGCTVRLTAILTAANPATPGVSVTVPE